MSKHLKIILITRPVLFPILGTKKPERRTSLTTRHLRFEFEGAKFINLAPFVNWPFSHPIASRRADESISNETSCKSFFNYFSTLLKNRLKPHEIRLIPIPALSIHPRPSPNNVPTRVKKSSSPLHENVSGSFPQRPRCFPETI